jgi:spermidine synthase
MILSRHDSVFPACLVLISLMPGGAAAFGAVVFEATSPYHHVRVVEQNGMRTLCFDDATQSRVSLADPLKGHFEYTEYFHMPWLWNTQIASVLMVGLGGASTQRSFEHYYPGATIETVEIDPLVVRVARDYFHFKESERQQVHVEDGRVYFRRSTGRHDLIILDAYVASRYGSAIPQHLATREFFELLRDHLTTNGIVAYNVIGSLDAWQADLVGAMCRTLKTVFAQVYLFPAKGSQNVVIVATRAQVKAELSALRQRATLLIQNRQITVPDFRERLEVFHGQLPPSVARSPVLTDDYAPVEGLTK